MTPNFDPKDMLIGSADYFLCPIQVKTVAPNIILLVDEYHFMGPRNKTNILVKDFGPTTFAKIKVPFKNAFYATTKDECFVSVPDVS